jgi:hypothetical protein
MADGWTLGEQTTRQGYLLGTLTAGVLSYCAYFSIKRAPSDPAWRWGAWTCTSLALWMIVFAPF